MHRQQERHNEVHESGGSRVCRVDVGMASASALLDADPRNTTVFLKSTDFSAASANDHFASGRRKVHLSQKHGCQDFPTCQPMGDLTTKAGRPVNDLHFVNVNLSNNECSSIDSLIRCTFITARQLRTFSDRCFQMAVRLSQVQPKPRLRFARTERKCHPQEMSWLICGKA